MTYESTEKPSLDEQYLVATNTSDLTLNPDRTCSATHLIAAGLVGNRMGEALRHLEAEWSAAGKPRKMTEDEIAASAREMPKRQGKPDVKRARTQALVGYATAMRHRAHQMRGWTLAIGLLGEWAVARDVDLDLLRPALYHWLNPTCPVCDGHGKRKLPEAPVLGKECHHCAGTGKWPRPLGAEIVQTWLKRCAGKAKRDRGALVHGAPIFGE